MKSPSSLLHVFPLLAGFRDWIWHVVMAWRGPALSRMARELVVRSVIWMLKAGFFMSVFWFSIGDHLAIWVKTAPAAPFPNFSTLVDSIFLSPSASSSWFKACGIFLVIGLMSPFVHRLRDLRVFKPVDGLSSVVMLQRRCILASWVALLISVGVDFCRPVCSIRSRCFASRQAHPWCPRRAEGRGPLLTPWVSGCGRV